jgi:hypothetical protein
MEMQLMYRSCYQGNLACEQTERWENNHITKRFSNRDGTSHLDKILEAADDDDDFSVIFK